MVPQAFQSIDSGLETRVWLPVLQGLKARQGFQKR
ncbi:hypothetical protein BLA15816_07896 [Burkholderia lata]|uniref:Uncharacterized protein n=1 Tax=Burkholderia lata (strain ATCC 17760 / DSM 23089 / LMG 22485 / NCIMB 9086 / R18194 / 383) TaxID=482957 RepID=A0A6P2RWK0_BURL3|nr:hypothetical protein BLA15945_07112 [Burkholderia lata]VWC50461.1 hypothetical protein BLA15816_07896 [Burkholderia lata]